MYIDNAMKDFFIEASDDKLMTRNNIGIFERISQYAQSDKELDQYTKEDFVKIITQFNSRTINRFMNIKYFLSIFVKWAVKKSYMTENQVEMISKISIDECDFDQSFFTYYFKNFGELYYTLEDAISCHAEREDTNEFDTVRCIIYLLWHGFDATEISNIQKSDVEYEKNIIYKTVGEKRVPVLITSDAMTVIREYAQAESFMSQKFGHADMIELKYRESNYLVRTYRYEQVTNKHVECIGKSINKHSDETGKKFTPVKIYLSGVYYRNYCREVASNTFGQKDENQLTELINAENSFSRESHYVQEFQYKKYKKVFWGN